MSGHTWMAMVLAVPALAWGGVAQAAAPAQVCTGGVPDFCLTYGGTVSAAGTATPETRAAVPVDLALTLANTSPAPDTDQGRWLDSIAVDLLSSESTGPLLTPSADLPNTLLVAGAASTCGPGGDNSYSGCTAGHGSALVNVTGTGLFDGLHSATFGIQRVANVRATTAFAEYQATVDFSLQSPFGAIYQTATTSLTVPQTASATAARLVLMTSGFADFPYPGGTAHADYSLDTVSLSLLGQSDQLANGTSADRSHDVLRLPPTCGPVSASGSATDRDGATVTVPQPVTIDGCPTVSTPTATGTAPYRASFTAAGAGIGGRQVDGYLWDFGDGTHASTPFGLTRHKYADSGAHAVSVVAVDDAGALSSPGSVTLRDSLLTLKGKSSVADGNATRLLGTLTSSGAGLAGRKLTLLRCTLAGKGCAIVAHATTRSGSHAGQYAFGFQPRRSALYRVSFAGGDRTIGTEAAREIRVH